MRNNPTNLPPAAGSLPVWAGLPHNQKQGAMTKPSQDLLSANQAAGGSSLSSAQRERMQMNQLNDVMWLVLGAALAAFFIGGARGYPKLWSKIERITGFEWYVIFMSLFILGSIWAIYLWGH